ncbi:MAG: BCCT family transporter, partial [Rickettsiales bacterium]
MTEKTKLSPLRNLLGVPQLVVLIVAICGVLVPDQLTGFVEEVATEFLAHFDWLILLSSSLFLFLCVYVMFSKYAHLKLGKDDEEPQYDTFSWLAMLFAAGMGSGLVFWGAAEPIQHMFFPPGENLVAGSEEAAKQAFRIVGLHWALHPWGIYAMAALTIAYFCFRKDQPMLPSAPMRGVKGKAWQMQERAVDALALLAVVFGVVASLGQGVLQVASGWAEWMGQGEPGWPTYLTVTIVLASCYMLSAAGGIGKGIKPLSDLNMVLCIALLVFVLIAGPTVQLFQIFVSSLGDYISTVVPMSFTLRQWDGGLDWTQKWTLHYLLWWIAWGPFVGVFVARISRGRTIRQFLLGVLLIPAFFSIFWFAVLGGNAVLMAMQGEQAFVEIATQDYSMATYAMLDRMPFAQITKLLTLVLVFIFLVTSADSGSYVLGMFSA